MVYESSYESGRKPFLPDPTRGHWAQPTDFIFVCLGLAFKMDIFSNSFVIFFELGVVGIIAYIACLAIYVVPLMVILSFMGQFSSSGFISVFRISPLFKGMGYVSLAVNTMILVYYSVFIAVPLLFFINSLKPVLPWSCEGFKAWSHEIELRDHYNLCNMTEHETIANETDADGNVEFNPFDYYSYEVPSILFFRSHFSNITYGMDTTDSISISWELVLCMMMVWTLIALVFYKCSTTQKIGVLLRYLTITTFALLVIMFIRLLFLHDALNAIEYFLAPSHRDFNVFIFIPLYALSAFGTGWGTVVSLASCNNFKTNIMRYSWVIGLGQLVLFVIFSLSTNLLEHAMRMLADDNYTENQWLLYLSSGSALANMTLPNLWSLLFFGMLCVSGFTVVVTQLFSVLTSIFDEFEQLRIRKTEITLGIIGSMGLCSIYFCTNHGVVGFSALAIDALFTQSALNLLLLLVVLWIYGRERFQRDIEFMLSQRFASWKIHLLRYVVPLILILTLAFSIAMAIMEHLNTYVFMHVVAIIFVALPWFFIPGYAIWTLIQTTGTLGMRIRRACRPTDWYPVESEDRQRYEEAMGNMDITHQLSEVGENVF